MKQKSYDKTVQMKIFNSNPNGRIMCELSNWDGRVYKIARNELKVCRDREDLENTGVYFLFGKDEQGNDTVYIGEAEKIYARLIQHINDKIYWNDCIAVITTGNKLNKAHVKYLEYQFYSIAKEIDRATVTNSNVPTCSSISEYDEAMLDEFIENTKLLVNILGYETFMSVEDIEAEDNDKHVFYLKVPGSGADAQGMIAPGGFIILKDSVISESIKSSMPKTMEELRKELIEKQIIVDRKFIKDWFIANTSPSGAGALITGCASDGPKAWIDDAGLSLSKYEENKNKT